MTTEALLHWLLRTSIEASVLILAVLGLRLMLGTRLSPAWRISLWMLVGMKLMLPAFIPAGFGLGAWMQRENAPVIAQSAVTPDISEPFEYSVSSVGQFESSSALSPAAPRFVFQLPQLLLSVWLIGSAAVLLAAFVRQRRFDAFLRHRPIAREARLSSILRSLSSLAGVISPTIVLMPAGTTPAMVGLRQPKLLLPQDWEQRFDERSLRHVMLHELLHVRQRDLLWNWAAIAVQALHWFNPLVWFVVSRFQADRELRCDAAALEILAPSERLDYGHTLLRIQETFFAPPAIAGLAPCVRNHPTLRQRILMITHPTTRQPLLQMLLVLTLSVLVSYSFTTARAAEKEVPAKVRGGETIKKPGAAESPENSDSSGKKPAMKDGEREGGKPSAERDGDVKKPGMRDGEGGVKKPGARDGDGEGKKPGIRDGEGGIKKPGAGDGEGTRKPGPRDGEKPRTGERDGEGMKKPGTRDGEGRKPSAERDGQKPRKGEGDSASASSGEVITLRVTQGGEAVHVGKEEVPMAKLRGYLSSFLPEHPGAKVQVTGDPDIPLKALHNTVDAVRDNGNKNVGIKTE